MKRTRTRTFPPRHTGAVSPPRRWPVNLADFEPAAKRRLAPMAYDYIAGGAGDELTLSRNREVFGAVRLKPRVLVDVSAVQSRIELLGQSLDFPILLAPVAYQKLAHPQGERATARGAGAAGALFVVSAYASTPIEEIAKVATHPLWLQLYVHPDRGFTRELVARGVAAGCRALCVTVDSPVFGARNREARAGFHLPAGVAAEHLKRLGGKAHKVGHLATQGIYSAMLDASLTWKDVSALCAFAKVPVVLKGILTAEDAKQAVASGAAGIIVSNHGGRNLDTLPATLEALPGVSRAVAGRIPVLLDGGIRRGTDVLKALALGAQAVLIGRPYMWGLAIGGAAGVTEVIRILRDEFHSAMALCGVSRLSEITQDALWNYSAEA